MKKVELVFQTGDDGKEKLEVRTEGFRQVMPVLNLDPSDPVAWLKASQYFERTFGTGPESVTMRRAVRDLLRAV